MIYYVNINQACTLPGNRNHCPSVHSGPRRIIDASLEQIYEMVSAPLRDVLLL